MNGYLLNFYKFSPSFNEEMGKLSVDGYNRSIVWSNFDRLEIRKINDFSQYRKSEISEQNWMGERQFAMLYELKEGSEKLEYAEYQTTEDECRFAFQSKKHEIEKNLRFFGVTFIDFTKDFHNYIYEESEGAKQDEIGKYINEQITEAIDFLIEQCNISKDKIAYEIYGILGGQDLAIIWLVNQFEYIAEIIQALQASVSSNQKKVVANAATIVGLKDINAKNVSYDDVTGKLFVKLTKKESFDYEQYKNDIREALGECSFDESNRVLFGEHDILFEVPAAGFICDLYKRNGLFHSKSNKFTNNFIQSKTEIVIQSKYDGSIAYVFPFEIIKSHLNEECFSNQRIKSLSQLVEKVVKSEWLYATPYLQETIWLLYEDFLKNITSSFTYPWSNDLLYQFEESMIYLSCLIESDRTNDVKYEELHHVISSMRQMMLHVAQANRLFFEIPNTHLKHTGAYSKILHMYYGVVKKYLELAYDISKFDSQSSVIPFITFDVTPIAKSKYCKYIETYDKNIVKIELPYDALVNISKYIKLLAHEVYHYIAPRDRRQRNNLVGAITFSMMIGQIAYVYMDERLRNVWNDKVLEDWLYTFQNIIRARALSCYVEDSSILSQFIPEYDDTAVWETFFNYFDDFFEDIFFESKEWIARLFEWMNNAIEQMNINFAKVENLDVDEFQEQMKNNKELYLKYPLDRDFRYALREATADYFMIQVTQMPLGEYLNYIKEYSEMMDSDKDNLAQKTRKSLIIQLFKGKEIKKSVEGITDKEEKNDKIYEIFSSEFDFPHEDLLEMTIHYVEIVENYQIYEEAIKKYFEMLSFDEIVKVCPRFEEVLIETRELLKEASEEVFYNNVRYVERFQKQKTLKDLEEDIKYYGKVGMKRPNVNLSGIERKPISLSSEKTYEDDKTEKATNLSELLELIEYAVLKVADDGTDAWFRGHSSDKYILIPSLYRMKDRKRFFYAGTQSRREILNSLLDLFRVRAYNSPELVDKLVLDDARVLAAMQHYKVPTNLLDWTTSIFSALYFALEKEINGDENATHEDAVIFVLNPVRMNIIRNKLGGSLCNLNNYKQIQYPIPAIDKASTIFEGYLPNQKIADVDSRFPIAGYIAYDNARISSQLGTFTVFGLDNQYDCYSEEIQEDKVNHQVDYSNCSIWDMQNKYKEYCKNNDNLEDVRFIAKVIINGDDKKKIAESLKKLGIKKARYYPELENISEELTLQVNRYIHAAENIL